MIRQISGATVFSMLLVVLLAQPAGAWTLVSETGRTGHWEVLDENDQASTGVNCTYQPTTPPSTSYLLRMNIRPPVVVNGDHAVMTWVGWRFKILQSPASESWTTIYTSSLQKDQASMSTQADGFKRRTWSLSGTPSGWYKVRIFIFFYRPGSQTVAEGKVALEYTNYLRKRNPYQNVTPGHCGEQY